MSVYQQRHEPSLRAATRNPACQTLNCMIKPAIFSVTDSAELNALLRILIEAKFRPEVPDADIASSRYVVAMIERVVEAQRGLALESGNDREVSNIESWQRAELNPLLLSAVRARLKECPKNIWMGWSAEQRRKHVLDVLSPLRADSHLVAELLDEMQDG